MTTAKLGRPTEPLEGEGYVYAFRGNCKVSGFSEYDSLTGYVTETYQREWKDAQGNTWRKTCTIINLGRPDRGTPVQEDAQLATEPMPGDEAAQQRAATWAATRSTRHRIIREKLIAYLEEHGPTPMRQLMPIAGVKNHGSMADHFAYHTGVYVRFTDKPAVWGLPGQTYTPPAKPAMSTHDMRLRDALLEHGPLTEKELSKRSNVYHGDLQRSIKAHPELFVIVGYHTVLGKKIARKWGLIGVHEVGA